VLEVASRNATASGGREDEGYWRRSCRQLMTNLVDLLMLANGRISVPGLYPILTSAPRAREGVMSDQWRADSFCFQCLASAERKPKSLEQRADFQLVTEYFLREFAGLSDKTRSVIVSTFTSMVDVLHRGVMRKLFCEGTNITPEDTE